MLLEIIADKNSNLIGTLYFSILETNPQDLPDLGSRATFLIVSRTTSLTLCFLIMTIHI